MVINLWGFMGSGKSTLGRYMANHYGWQQLDSDQEIERREERTISTIFREEGEAYFRNLETSLLRQLVEKKEKGELDSNLILTTGGGMPIRAENRRLLSQLGLNVFLDVPFEEIVTRLQRDESRPLWDTSQLAEMEKRYKDRLPIYKQADICLSAAGKSVAQLAEEVWQLVHRYGTNGAE